jgi:hypothetical protein
MDTPPAGESALVGMRLNVDLIYTGCRQGGMLYEIIFT